MSRHLDRTAAFLAAVAFAISPWWLWQYAQAATSVVAVGIIVAVLYLFDRLIADPRPSSARVVGSSLAIGILLLAKAQYDALFAAWLWAALHRRWRLIAATFVVHLVPLAVWMLALRAFGLEYRNVEVDEYGQGVWFLDLMRRGEFWTLWASAKQLAGETLSAFLRAFSPLMLAAAAVGAARGWTGTAQLRRLLIAGPAALLAFLVAIQRPESYLGFDGFFFVYPLAGSALAALARSGAGRVGPVLVGAFLAVDLVVGWYLSVPEQLFWQPSATAWRAFFGGLFQ
jgi:hypothetical protein